MKPSIWYIVIGVIIGFGVGVGIFLNMSDQNPMDQQLMTLYVEQASAAHLKAKKIQ